MLVAVGGSAPLREKQHLQGNDSESEKPSDSSEKQVNDVKEGQKENRRVLKEKIHFPGVRKEERELDIPPRERLAVVVSCQAK